MKKLLLVGLLLALFPLTSALAVKVSSLYEADIPVTAQSDDERDQAAEQGLMQVLIKLSGDPNIGQNPVVKEAIKRASYYVQEYSYASPSPSAAQYVIQLHYDANEINQLLKQAGAAHWGTNRPLILAWVTLITPQHTPEIISSDSGSSLSEALEQQGKKYGVPLILPMMDVDDMNKVSPDDVVNMVLPTLEAAAQRYAPDALLVGNIEPNDNGFDSKWQLVLGDDQWDWTLAGKTPNEIVTNLLNQVSQTLAKHYAVKTPNAPQLWLKLEIENVTGRDDLAQLIQYLKQLTPVQQVQLMQVSGSVVEVAVLVHGTLTIFQQNASIGKHLQFKSQEAETNKLLYDWVH